MKVKSKTLKELKKYARHLGGDMNETLHYFIRASDGSLLKTLDSPECTFTAIGLHVLNHNEEFLVVDHPNPISKYEYESTKILYKEIKK